MERGAQGGRRRALARLLKGEGGGAAAAPGGRSSRFITFYLVTEPPDDMPDLECEEVKAGVCKGLKRLSHESPCFEGVYKEIT